jgi:N-acetylglucosaminyldiphosphoundecaprenol N-acetyl-beta-D-mannosaminyltransferase
MVSDPFKVPGPLGVPRRRRWFVGLRRRAYPLLAVLGEAASRALDVLVSVAVLLLLSPVLVVRAVRSRRQTGAVFAGSTRVGRFQVPFRRLRFAGSGRFRDLAVWLNVLRGDLSLVGPRPLSVAEAAVVPAEDLVRFTVRPGVISTFRVRGKVGLAHERESAMDRELVYEQTLGGDLGLAARSLVSGVLGGSTPRETPPVLNLFGIPIVNTTMDEAVQWIIDRAGRDERGSLAFVNPDCLNIAWSHGGYREFLRAAERVLPDGIGIHLGCRMLGQGLRANVNGTDLFPRLCESAAREGLAVYLLGARPGIARAAADAMVQRYPELVVAGARDGYFQSDEEPGVVDAINASGARILLVAFGAPRQELWIAHWRDRLEVPVAMGVGGLFDFYSGRIARAPVWMREIGLEWVYRLMQEPGRMWRRYVIGNPLFLYRVWQQARHPERFPEPSSTGDSMATDGGRAADMRAGEHG